MAPFLYSNYVVFRMHVCVCVYVIVVNVNNKCDIDVLFCRFGYCINVYTILKIIMRN